MLRDVFLLYTCALQASDDGNDDEDKLLCYLVKMNCCL